MITYKKGNILDANAEVLVNTVNIVGVMGKGIALQFKKNFPENNKAYTDAVKDGSMQLGVVQIVPVHSLNFTKYVVNFPTKDHWRYPSQLEWIESGLKDLKEKLQKLPVKSIAIPPLGCGNGGLDWELVKPRIERALADLPIEVQLYEPSEKIKEALMKEENPSEARLTPPRAMLLHLMYKYRALGEGASEFAAEKLAYFLQRFGERQLKLEFKQGYYGPYSGKVRHILYALNGYYLSGYEQKQTKPFEELEMKVEKTAELKAYIQNNLTIEQNNRLEAVSLFIQGYESAYGMELLATVDYLMQRDEINDPDLIYSRLWSVRKAEMFTKHHIAKAVCHLEKSLPR